MIKKPRILSQRFEDNGLAEEYVSASMRQLIQSLRNRLLTGELKRLSHKKCPLCENSEFLLIGRRDRWGFPLDTLICERCGLVFSSAYFSNESAEIYYSRYSNQFKNKGRSAEQMFQSRTHPSAYSWLRYNWIKDNLEENFAKIENVMEIGCSDGCNLYPFHQNGCTVFGCDYDEDRMNAGRAVGMNLLTGGAGRLKEMQTRADLVILSHSLEHMPDVDIALKEARELLAENGKIYIEVPGLKGWNLPRKYMISDEWIKTGNNFLNYLHLEHTYNFELETLTHFATRNGLVPIAGDELIRVFFKIGGKSKETDFGEYNRGQRVYEYLLEVERDWQKHNPLWRRAARYLMHRFYLMDRLGRYWIKVRDKWVR